MGVPRSPSESDDIFCSKTFVLKTLEYTLIVREPFHCTKMKFSITNFFSKCDQKTADLVTYSTRGLRLR